MRALARLLVLSLSLTLAPRASFADAPDVNAAKASFKAGAIAYAAGDYLAAIQALEAAHRITPLPAIEFSLAQAERRQYVVSRDVQYLNSAIAHYRSYLEQVPIGGRRADATDALSQLEPLAASAAGAAGGTSSAQPSTPSAEAAKTRLMVSSSVEGALVSLDGGRSGPSPLIMEVAPGAHRVRVEAPGFTPVERGVVAVSGALVPVEVTLRELPATVLVRAPDGADLYLDGRLIGKADKLGRVALASGAHTFGFAKNGHETKTVAVRLARGETKALDVELTPTKQRVASYVVLGASAVSFGAGIVLSIGAVEQELRASTILERHETQNITAQELAEYDEAVRRRDQLRLAAGVSFATSLVTLVTGLALHEFDRPTFQTERPMPAREQGKRAVTLGVGPSPAGAGLSGIVTF